ncbi:MAG: division/cell wall cluster transcriptional repressor MraZ [Candidatus Scalindua sp.]|nr:division/cell wall cluster transcriptional repressor MraZ [Candidatus Scalindua sp.]
MFTGTYHHTIDDNNRLAIPSSMRKSIDVKGEGKGFFITPGLDRCLAIYPHFQFEELKAKIKQLNETNPKARIFKRLFFSRSNGPNTCDKQGRFIVPQHLKEYACLEKEIVIVGVMDKIEVWDLKEWNKFEKEHAENFEKDAEDLFQ